jgi:hypothetical protein
MVEVKLSDDGRTITVHVPIAVRSGRQALAQAS